MSPSNGPRLAPDPARLRGRSRFRFALVTLACFAIAVAVALAPRMGAEAQVQASAEFDGANCNVQIPGTWASNSRLPDPFTRIDGTRITTRSQWECRRAEIKELAERTIYGDKPAPPSSVTGTVTSSRITVNVSDQGRSTSFSATVQLPSGSGPFPAVIVYGGFGADTDTILSTGTAVINYDPGTVGAEGTSRNNKQGAFYSLYGASSSTGILMAQAWGVSRLIDVIERSGGDILNNSTGVTGCSRYGKGAFVAGAFDQRVDLTMPIESGTGGVPAMRSIAQESGSQGLSSAYGEQPWLGDAFNSYTGNPNGLPVDTHQIVGMIAPRGLFIMENPHVEWLGARSGHVAALGGAEIYKALGAGSNISYLSNTSNGTHCATRSEWQTPLRQSIQAFLHDNGNPPGTINAHPNKSGNLSQWRSWTTPTLTGGPGETETPTEPTTDPPTTTPPPTGSTDLLQSVSTGKCVNLPNGNTADGTKVQLYTCAEDPSQQFTYTADRELRVRGKCLDTYSGSNGTQVQIYACHGGDNQKWTFGSDGTIRNAQYTNACLDVYSSSNGAPVQVYACHGRNNQQWLRV
ncbi:RICIN domain-containing protein [Glycomyces sp. TRM65418]|uniref:RICIN domain-containing protein n=1 Tax=Glycomyces sp. TRM65418 TaxID=2867006 RepID=UPI001CE50D20|nr:RICIN domain-containing protein [Glycomyces sp. TRM65418]MCC3765368.1 RICIN domain-containing protein [Glycomyces sp. TRM65418]QZD54985.1 RICIN domain-containing protein [Glycomyces sp. TRM65418]